MSIYNNIKYIIVDFLPPSVSACLTECAEPDGDFYTVMLNRNCGDEKIAEGIEHELEHCRHDDFRSPLSVGEIEIMRHK